MPFKACLVGSAKWAMMAMIGLFSGMNSKMALEIVSLREGLVASVAPKYFSPRGIEGKANLKPFDDVNCDTTVKQSA